MTVAAYLDFVASIKGIGRGERRRRVGEVLERCRIPDVRGRLIGRLSKGYRQRVGSRRRSSRDPDVLILDEPTIGLDPKQIVGIRELISQLAGAHTIILSTHILPEVSMVCDSVIIIHRGPGRRLRPARPADAGALAHGAAPDPDRGTGRAGRAVAAGHSPRPARGGAGRRGRDRHVRPRGRPHAGRAAGSRPPRRAAALGPPRAQGPGPVAGGRVHQDRGQGRSTGRRWWMPRQGRPRRWRREDLGSLKKELRVYFALADRLRRPDDLLLDQQLVLLPTSSASTSWQSIQAAMNSMMGRDLSRGEMLSGPLFQNMSVIMLLMMPILTMRLFAKEKKKSGTIDCPPRVPSAQRRGAAGEVPGRVRRLRRDADL